MMKNVLFQSVMCFSIAATAWAQDVSVEVDEVGDDARKVTIQVDDQALIDDTDAKPAQDRWIGVGCDQVNDALRAHVDLPEGIGLLVLQVMPKSPAVEAGIGKHDILISAGDRKLGTVEDLIAAIAAAGDNPIEMKWMHSGNEIVKEVTPVVRPQEYRVPQLKVAEGAKVGDLDNIKGWLKAVEKGGMGANRNFKFKILGPGIQMHQSQSKVLPGGLEIEIERDGEGPAKVKVRQGKSSWETTEGKLDMLPEDARKEVESMLNDKGLHVEMQELGNLDAQRLNDIIQQQMKEQFEGIPDIDALDLDLPWPKMNERFDEMNRRMEKMMERIEQLQLRNAPPENDDDEA